MKKKDTLADLQDFLKSQNISTQEHETNKDEFLNEQPFSYVTNNNTTTQETPAISEDELQQLISVVALQKGLSKEEYLKSLCQPEKVTPTSMYAEYINWNLNLWKATMAFWWNTK